MRHRERRSAPLARTLRRRMTKAESHLWARLRRSGVPGLRFRKQHPVGPYVADFASFDAMLVIEVDGETHWRRSEIARDARKQTYLEARGWRVLRVTNKDVYENLDGVLETILRHAPPPALRATSPARAGEDDETTN